MVKKIQDLKVILSQIDGENISVRIALQEKRNKKQSTRADGDNTSIDRPLKTMIALCGQAETYNGLLKFKAPNFYSKDLSRFQEIMQTLKNRLTEMLKEGNFTSLQSDTNLIERLVSTLRKDYKEELS